MKYSVSAFIAALLTVQANANIGYYCGSETGINCPWNNGNIGNWVSPGIVVGLFVTLFVFMGVGIMFMMLHAI